MCALDKLRSEPEVTHAETYLEKRPHPFFVRLQLVVVGNAGEIAADRSIETCLSAFHGFKHPPEGMQALFLLDACSPTLISDVSEAFDPLVARIEAFYRESKPGALARVVACHCVQPFGMSIPHPNLKDPAAAAPDPLERRMAALLEVHLAPGVANSALLNPDPKPPRFDFAAVGGATAVFPRVLLLRATSSLLAADLLRETSVPSNEDSAPDPFEKIDRSTMFAQAIERMSHLCSVQTVMNTPELPRATVFQRLLSLPLGEERPVWSQGIRVVPRIGRPTAEWSPVSPQSWPATYAEIREEALRRIRESLPQEVEGLGANVAKDVLRQIVTGTNGLVSNRLGGTERAREFLNALQSRLAGGLTRPEGDAFRKIEPDARPGNGELVPRLARANPPEGAERFATVPNAELAQKFAEECSRVSGPTHFIGRGIVLGAILGALAPWWPFAIVWAWTAVGIGVGAFYLPWRARYRRAELLKRYLMARLEDELGEEIYRAVQRQIGVDVAEGVPKDTPPDEEGLGAIPQLWRHLAQTELPALDAFDARRKETVEALRCTPEWPNGYSFSSDLILEDDPRLLYEVNRPTDELRRVDARSELEKGLFEGWRRLDFGKVADACRARYMAEPLGRYLEPAADGTYKWPVGRIREQIARQAWQEAWEPEQAQWICERLDKLFHRGVPLAISFPLGVLDTPDRYLLAQLPPSLDWTRLYGLLRETSAAERGGIPSGSDADQIAGRIISYSTPNTPASESDVASVCFLGSTTDRETLVSWLGDRPTVQPSLPPDNGKRRKKRPGGYLPDPGSDADVDATFDPPMRDGRALPPELSYESLIGPAYDQGRSPHCVAYAAKGLKAYHEWKSSKARPEFDPDELYARCKENDGIKSKKGTYIRVAMDVLRHQGMLAKDGNRYPIASSARLESVDAIRKALYLQGPVMLGCRIVPEAFYALTPTEIRATNEDEPPSHATLIVGYDDRRRAFRLRNSWGEDWADCGHCWLPYDYLEKVDPEFTAWTAVDSPDVQPHPPEAKA